jgi:putative redox protein
MSGPAPRPGLTVTVESTEGYRQLVHAGPHLLIADEPEARGGGDAGPSPSAMVLAGLGACTAMTLQMYAARKGWSLGPITVVVRMWSEAGRPRIARSIELDGPLTDAQLVRLGEIAERTPVTRLLLQGVPIGTDLSTKVPFPLDPQVDPTPGEHV